MDDKNYINRLIDGDARAFDEIYYAYKDLFIGVLRKSYGHDYDHAIDLYHRAMAALDNNVRRGRIKHDELPDEKLKAYIINTGKWISLNDHRKRQTLMTFDTEMVFRKGNSMADDEADAERSEQLSIIRKTVLEMKMPCSQLLDLAIYERKTHEEISAIMGYSSAQSVANQRHRCMDKLVNFAKSNLKKSGYDLR